MMKGGENMSDYKREIEMVRSNREYETTVNLKISKVAEERIIEVSEKLNIEFEEAAELLIEIGASKIDC